MSGQPANPVTPFYNPKGVYTTTNPRKRPHVGFMPDTLVKSPMDHLAKVVVEHIHQVDITSPPSSPSGNYSKALQAATAFDALFSLTPSKTLLEQRPITIPPKPVIYVHRHPDAYTNAITAREESSRAQEAALRVFLDAFYYECGFRAWYQRLDYVAGMSSDCNCSDFKGQQTEPYTQEEQKKYVRYHAVVNALPQIPNMTKKDATYLVGRLSGRDKLHESHHRLGMRAMAIYLERFSKQWTDERKIAILKAFTWLTGYSNYANAYNNEAEMRQFTDYGILPGNNLFDIPDDVNMESEEERDALMQEVCI